MGNREDLLAGARKCLYEKGYARTTSRDIREASGVSLAGIGYHFGSKEALLNTALQQLIEEWGDSLGAAVGGSTDFVTAWTRVMESFEQSRPLWAIQFELLAHLEHTPELRKSFAEANEHARRALAELFKGVIEPAGETEAAKLGAFYQVLLAGLASVGLAEPDNLPAAADLLASMRLVSGGRTAPKKN